MTPTIRPYFNTPDNPLTLDELLDDLWYARESMYVASAFMTRQEILSRCLE